MKNDRRPSLFGLLIVLIALVLVAVGIMGLLSRNSRTVISLPGVVRNATSDANANTATETQAEAPLAAPPAPAGQSAVVRGGSRGQPTPTTRATVDSPATGEVMLPGETTPTSNTGGLQIVPGTSALRIEVLSVLYDVSGKPSQGCAVFDNRLPTRRFTLQLAVVNDSGANYQPGEWGAAAYAGAARVTLCFSGAGGLPAFAQGTRQPITLVAFTNPDQAVTSISISTLNGLSARACFEEERVVACPAT